MTNTRTHTLCTFCIGSHALHALQPDSLTLYLFPFYQIKESAESRLPGGYFGHSLTPPPPRPADNQRAKKTLERLCVESVQNAPRLSCHRYSFPGRIRLVVSGGGPPPLVARRGRDHEPAPPAAPGMMYLAPGAHWQFLGLVAGLLAWILLMAATGLNEWRLWRVDDVSVVTSGVAWVGIWRACFYSHALPEAETCRAIGLSDPFAPPEVAAAQVLMVVALMCGLLGNVGAAVAMRLVYFSVERRGNVRPAFVLAGTAYLLAGTICSVPLAWNVRSVLKNCSIEFPPEFHLPAAPAGQWVGSAVGVGVTAAVLMLVSGLLFLGHRYARKGPGAGAPKGAGAPPARDRQGRDNPAFHAQEVC
ncbi:claudin-34 [Spinachia spinachia]